MLGAGGATGAGVKGMGAGVGAGAGAGLKAIGCGALSGLAGPL
jgi:hypothetical protein